MLKKTEETLLLRIIPKLLGAMFAFGVTLIILSLLNITDVMLYAIIITVFSAIAWFVTR